MILATGCFHSPSDANGDGGDAGSDDTPCTLASLDLKAATLSGCSTEAHIDGPRGTAYFANPVNMKLGPSGISYVADFDSSYLRRVDPTGTATTLFSGSAFSLPFGLLVLPSGYLLVETDDDDMNMHSSTTGTLWLIDPASGSGHVLVRDHGRPRGLALAPDGTVYTADYVHHVVEHFDPNNPSAGFTTIAGTWDVEGHINSNGTAPSTMSWPWDLVMDANGDLLVAEFGNNVIRKVTPGAPGRAIVTDYAGNGTAGKVDGALASAELSMPKGIAIDASGALYVTEEGNGDIRKIANGMVTTLAGTGTLGYSDNDDPQQAQFYGVEGLDVSSDGTKVVVADGNNGDGKAFNHVRVITP